MADSALIVAIMSGGVALASAALAFVSQSRVTRMQHDLALERASAASDERVRAIVSKYREPLVQAATDLQSRLFSTVQLGFMQLYFDRSARDKRYALENTLYVVAEYLGWVEVIRREIQFLDLGDEAESRRLAGLLRDITQLFGTDNLDLTFRLFRGEQRAIGELMIEPEDGRVIGFARFSSRLSEPEFRRWFEGLEASIELLATAPGKHEARLIEVQHALVELVEFLDPHATRVPRKYRSKIDRVRMPPASSE